MPMFGRFLRVRRGLDRIAGRGLARILGVRHSYLRQIESGERPGLCLRDALSNAIPPITEESLEYLDAVDRGVRVPVKTPTDLAAVYALKRLIETGDQENLDKFVSNYGKRLRLAVSGDLMRRTQRVGEPLAADGWAAYEERVRRGLELVVDCETTVLEATQLLWALGWIDRMRGESRMEDWIRTLLDRTENLERVGGDVYRPKPKTTPSAQVSEAAS